MNKIDLYTIGFCKKDARTFFSLIIKNNISNVIDIRLNNSSQLAGFAKGKDIDYFLEKICRCGYEHLINWAPTKEILDAYKKKKINWEYYENRFNKLLDERHIEKDVTPDALNNACLLCSEIKPDRCHRRLVAEYLKAKFGNINIIHL